MWMWDFFKQLALYPDEPEDAVIVGLLVLASPVIVPMGLALHIIGKVTSAVVRFLKKVWDSRDIP